jgi:arabinoxylan arabinofuranohydrolase
MTAPNRSLVRRGGIALGVATVLAASGLNTAAAFADTSAASIIKYRNASDPHVTDCPDTTGGTGLCLYASNDTGSGGTTDNGYPMDKTYLYTLEHGLDPSNANNWVDRGVVLNESQYSWVPNGAKHLWAPAQAAKNGTYYLYVPDVSDKSSSGVHTSSHIGVSTSTNPRGPFTYQQQVSINGYASDPHAFNDPNGTSYLVYANGDFNNCGGLSIGTLNSDMKSLSGSPQQITINGLSALGTCGSTGRPYLEGASLYWFGNAGFTTTTPYYLVFAAKPNTSNEVIAYATASSPAGPYTYKGTIMGGSSTEWTNQASVQKFGSSYVFMYHDGPSGNHNRKAHAECLFFNTDGTIKSITRSPHANTADDFNHCWKP